MTQLWKVDADCCIRVSYGTDGTVVYADESPGLPEPEEGDSIWRRLFGWLKGSTRGEED